MATDVSAVILAAGRGKRMLPLTETKPKPLQNVLGKNLIEWKLEALPQHIVDVVMVIGYQGDQIRDFFGESWNGKSIRYIVQNELNGTAGALFSAKDILGDRFLVMMGDDLYAKDDVAELLKHEWAVLVQAVHQKEMGGEMVANADGTFAGINEARHFVEDGLVNTGLYMIGKEIFDHAPAPIGGSSTEFGLPHTLAVLAKEIPIRMIRATKWLQITSPEDLLHAERSFLD